MMKRTNRNRCWLLTAAMVCVMAGMAAAQSGASSGGKLAAPDGPQNREIGKLPGTPAEGAKLSITHCEASVRVTMPQPQGPKSRYVSRNFEVYARLDVPGGSAPAWCERFEITELRDSEGKDLLAGINRRRESDEMRRYNLAQQLINQYIHERTINTTVNDSVRGLKELPTQLSVIKIRADLIISRKPTLVKVPFKVMDEPMTVVPGMTLFVTRIEEENKAISASIEVRSRDPHAGNAKSEADRELARPIFAGIAIRNTHDGKIGTVMPIGQPVELHDESIVATQHLILADQHVASDGTIEVLIFDQVERVSVDSTIKDVELTIGGTASPE